MLVYLTEGDRPFDSEGRMESTVLVGLAKGARPSGSDGGAVSPVLAGAEAVTRRLCYGPRSSCGNEKSCYDV